MDEIWKDIPGYEGQYQVSNRGRVQALVRHVKNRSGYRTVPGHIMSQQLINSGYCIVHIAVNGVRTAHLVHRLVAESFVSGCAETVNHKNGIKTDNTAENLEWVSYSDNHHHAVSIGLNPTAKRVIGVSPEETIGPFNSIACACVHLGRPRNHGSHISQALLGRRNMAFGFRWQYA